MFHVVSLCAPHCCGLCVVVCPTLLCVSELPLQLLLSVTWWLLPHHMLTVYMIYACNIYYILLVYNTKIWHDKKPHYWCYWCSFVYTKAYILCINAYMQNLEVDHSACKYSIRCYVPYVRQMLMIIDLLYIACRFWRQKNFNLFMKRINWHLENNKIIKLLTKF